MASNFESNKYPVGKFRFKIEADSNEIFCTEISGVDASVDTYEYREGSDMPWMRKCAGLKKFGNLTLKNAITDRNALTLWDWWNIVYDAGKGGAEAQRKDMTITLFDNDNKPRAKWQVANAFPSKYTGPDFNSSSSEAATESLELVHEGIRRIAV